MAARAGSRLGVSPMRTPILLAMAALVAAAFLGFARYATTGGPPGEYEVRQGDIRLAQNDYAGALARFDAALARDPEHAGARMGRAIALLESSRAIEAEAEFGAVIDSLRSHPPADAARVRPGLAAALANRGVARDRMGRHEDALADYEAALAVDARAVGAPSFVDRVLMGAPRPSTVAKRAGYLREQLALPPERRVLRLPERDADEQRYKP